jgi:hypothetical protein
MLAPPMYEHRAQPLLPRRQFYHRLARHGILAVAIMAGSLVVGILGYHVIEHQGWIDAYASATMILSGMGPLTPLQTNAGKLFAGTYALFSGIVFLSTVGLLIAPFAHRMLHRFHLEDRERR